MQASPPKGPAFLSGRSTSDFGLVQALDSFRRYDTWRLSRYLETGDSTRGGVLKFNGATLLHFSDVGYFNRAYEFGRENVDDLRAIEALFRKEYKVPRSLGVSLVAREGFDLDTVGEMLRRYDFEPTNSTARLGLDLECDLASVLTLESPSANGSHRKPVGSGSEDHAWFEFRQPVHHEYDSVLDLYLNGFQSPVQNHCAAKRNMLQLFDQPELVTWCAFDQGTPVALGMLFIKPPVGVLVAGVTSPAYQQRGVHEALIQLRIAHAKALGCRHLYAWADADGQSCRNLIAQGFGLLRIDRVWSQRTES